MSDDIDLSAAAYRIPARGHGPDAGTRRLLIAAGGLAATLLLVIGAWSIRGHRGGAVPYVQADARPIRVKPDNPGGLQVAGQNDEIMSGDNDPQAGKLAPAPEAPAPQALRAQEKAERVPPTPASSIAAASSSLPSAGSPPVAALLPAGSARQTTPFAAAGSPGSGSTADRKPVSTRAPAPVQTGKVQVQLAAVASEDAAQAEWQRLSKRLPDLLGSRKPAVTKIEREGKPLWRVRTGGFADIADATAFCERVRQKGAGCSIASF